MLTHKILMIFMFNKCCCELKEIKQNEVNKPYSLTSILNGG